MNITSLLCLAAFAGNGLALDDPPAKGPTKTILVYELDSSKAEQQAGDRKLLIEALNTLIYPKAAAAVVILHRNKDPIQINLPTGKQPKALTSDDVLRVKDLVAKVGALEFRILANEADDAKAIAEAKAMLADAAVQEELKKLQHDGALPPGLRTQEKQPKKYTIQLTEARSVVTYSWIELGPQERRMLNLDNAAKDDPKRNLNWLKLAQNRNRALTLSHILVDDKGRAVESSAHLLRGALFFSRECRDRNLPEEERKAKTVEYFVLARDPEFDETTGKQTPAVTGAYLANVIADRARRPPGLPKDIEFTYPMVRFTLNAKGTRLFHDLTRKNAPSDEKGKPVKI